MNLNTKKVRAAAMSGSITLSGVIAAGLLRNIADGWGPIGLAVGGVAAATVLTAGVGRSLAKHAATFDHIDDKYRASIANWITAGAATNGGIIGATMATPNAWMATAVLAVSAAYATAMVAAGQERYYTEIAPRRDADKAARQAEQQRKRAEQQQQQGINPLTGSPNSNLPRYANEEEALFYKAAQRSGLPHLILRESRYLYDTDGTCFGLQYRCEINPNYDYGGKQAPTEITAEEVKRFAQQINQYMPTRLETDWISHRSTGVIGEYLININQINLMKKLRPYLHDDVTPRRFSDPVLVGYDDSAEPIYLPLNQHGGAVGGSTSGKTSLLNMLIASAARCPTHDQHERPVPDGCLIWIGGQHKFKRTWGEWIEPYMDTGEKSPFDLIAYGRQDVADMLAEALRISDHRYKQLRPDKNQPAIWIIIDECKYVLEKDDVKAWYDGDWYTASQLAGMIMAATASSNIYLVLATQHGTYPNYGKSGSTICANMAWNACFYSKDTQEPYRQTGVTLPVPQNRGEFWLTSMETDLTKGKAIYIQERAKKQLAEGEVLTVADVSLNRRHIIQRMDDYSYEATTDIYRKRYTDAKQLLEYMSGQRPSPAPSHTSDDEDDTVTADDVYDMDLLADLGLGNLAAEIRAEVDGSGEGEQKDATASTQPPKPAPVVTTTDEPKVTVPDAIREVLSDTPGLTSGDVAFNVATRYDFNEGSVKNQLTTMNRKGQVYRSGTYYYPADTSAEEVTSDDDETTTAA